MRVWILDDPLLAQTALANIPSASSDVEHFDSANDALDALGEIGQGLLRCFASRHRSGRVGLSTRGPPRNHKSPPWLPKEGAQDAIPLSSLKGGGQGRI
jgi:hypothetical protein